MKSLLILLALFSFSVTASPKDKHHHKQGYKRSYKKKKHPKGFKKGLLEGVRRTPHLMKSVPIPGKTSLYGTISKAQNQGSCGCCWAFSLTGTLRDTLTLAGKDPGPLAFNYLINCAKDQGGCNGGSFSGAEHMIGKKGPPLDLEWPFAPKEGACKKLPKAASAGSYRMLGGEGGPSFKDIAYAIGIEKKPISIDIAADDEWEAYDSGTYDACDADYTKLNHMIMAIGYDCGTSVDSAGNCVFDEKGELPGNVGLIQDKNSWGTEWGEDGTIWQLFRGKDGLKCNGVATDALVYDLEEEPSLVEKIWDKIVLKRK